MESAVRGYYRDHWEGQMSRANVWIEKDALVGVIEGVVRIIWGGVVFTCC